MGDEEIDINDFLLKLSRAQVFVAPMSALHETQSSQLMQFQCHIKAQSKVNKMQRIFLCVEAWLSLGELKSPEFRKSISASMQMPSTVILRCSGSSGTRLPRPADGEVVEIQVECNSRAVDDGRDKTGKAPYPPRFVSRIGNFRPASAHILFLSHGEPSVFKPFLPSELAASRLQESFLKWPCRLRLSDAHDSWKTKKTFSWEVGPKAVCCRCYPTVANSDHDRSFGLRRVFKRKH